MIRRLLAAVVVVAGGIAMPMTTSSARAADSYEGPCIDNVGVTVVVDFQELGGGVNVRCAPGPVTSGLDALDKAGILWEGTRQFPGFVCRIAGLPGPDREACGVTPPATAYWTYWAAQRGGDWCYSSVGAGSRKPPPGSVEGWSFALDKVAVDVPPPSIAPPAPIPGQAPNPIKGSDCGGAASAPTTSAPPPTPAAPPPTAAAIVPPAAGGGTTDPPAQNPAQPATATTRPAQAGASGTTIIAATTTTASNGDTATTSSSSTSTSDAGTADSTTSSTLSSDSSTPDTAVPLGTVDLSDDQRGGSGFSAATVGGLGIAAGLAGAGALVARRRRGMP